LRRTSEPTASSAIVPSLLPVAAVIGGQQPAGRRARHHDIVRKGEGRAFPRMKAARLGGGDAGLQRQRMMDQRDQRMVGV
jgi:hypothetical protein